MRWPGAHVRTPTSQASKEQCHIVSNPQETAQNPAIQHQAKHAAFQTQQQSSSGTRRQKAKQNHKKRPKKQQKGGTHPPGGPPISGCRTRCAAAGPTRTSASSTVWPGTRGSRPPAPHCATARTRRLSHARAGRPRPPAPPPAPPVQRYEHVRMQV